MSQRATIAIVHALRSGLWPTHVPNTRVALLTVRRVGGLVKAQRRQTDLAMINKRQTSEDNKDTLAHSAYSSESLTEMLRDREALELLKRNNSPLRSILIKSISDDLDALNKGDFSNIKQTVKLVRLLREKRITLDMKPSNKILIDIMHYPKKAFYKFNEHITEILGLPTQDTEKLNLIYQFMNTIERIRSSLSETFDIAFVKPSLKEVVKLVEKTKQEHEFFKRLVEVESVNVSEIPMRKIRYKLKEGSTHDREMYEFRYMFMITDDEERNLAKATFVKMYSFDMIRQITIRAVKNKDPLAQEYLDLLMARYVVESKTAEDLNALNSRLYEVITYYSVRMGGYRSALELLETMHINNIELTPKIYHLLISSLRKFKLYDASLSMFRQAPQYFEETKHINDKEFKSLMVNELLALLRIKFPDDPKILIAHFVTIFKQSEVMLNDLGMLKLVYEKEIGSLDNTSSIPKAELDPFYHQGHILPTIENMTQLYMSVLDSIQNSHATQNKAEIYVKLFDKFLHYTSTIQSFQDSNDLLKSHPFSKGHLDGAIINVFVRHALQTLHKPSIALSMTKRFLTTCHMKRFNGFNSNSIIQTFYQHSDIHGQSYHELLAILKQYNIEPTPKLMIAKVFKHYDRDEIALSQLWYKKLLESGYDIRNRRLIKFISKLGWDFPPNFDQELLKEMNVRRNKAFEDLTIYEDESEIEDPETINELNEKLKYFKKS